MLPLSSIKWAELTTFTREPSEVPDLLESWLGTIGLEHEAQYYEQWLFDMFLHQTTITNLAFAIVPYLVQICGDMVSSYRIKYLIDICLIEASRITYGLYFNRVDTEAYPNWLMNDYYLSIVQTRSLVEDALESVSNDSAEIKRLAALKPALSGNADLAWHNWHNL